MITRSASGVSRSCVAGCATVCLLLATFLSGCATMKYGVPPKVERLQSLQRGVSTKTDALSVLGEPRGRGAARMSPDQGSRDVLFYEYAESDGAKVELKFLLVFFDDGRYDGYLWFSSAALISKTE
jgi:hypothetical protein